MRGFGIWYDELQAWDLKSARAGKFRAAHPDFKPLGLYIQERVELVRCKEVPGKKWPVYGISNKEGVFLSHMQPGAEFRVPYKAVYRDWFFHNPTRANVGSIGRVGDVLPDAVTSPEYQVWSISSQDWMPRYMEILLQMPFFRMLIRVHRVGTVKERLYARNLMEIPVPPRDAVFQANVCRYWDRVVTRIDELTDRVAEHEKMLVAEVLEAADIRIYMPPPRSTGFSLLSDEVSRWSVAFNRHTWMLEDLIRSTRFARRRLSEVAEVNPGRTRELRPESVVAFVPMEAVSEISGEIERIEEEELGRVSHGYTPFEEGDVLWAKITPCMQNGKSAVARALPNGTGFGSTEFHVIRSRDPQEVLPEYLWVILRLDGVRQAAQRYFTGSAGQQRVPATFLEDLEIPVPPLSVQSRIRDKISERRQAIWRDREMIDALRARLLVRVERWILSGSFPDEEDKDDGHAAETLILSA